MDLPLTETLEKLKESCRREIIANVFAFEVNTTILHDYRGKQVITIN